MNFGIATINSGRKRVFELWCASIRRLRQDTQIYIPAVCTSGEEDKPICDEYHIAHFTQENKPVSLKWNTSFKYLRDIGCEYALVLGSDDLISTDLLRALMKEMDKGTSVIGINTVYFYATEGMHKGQLAKFKSGQILGVAKAIHKSALDPIGWHICPVAKNFGIDHGIMDKAIQPYVTTKAFVEGVCVDVKTKDNINKWTAFGKTRPIVDSKLFYDILSEEEIKLLRRI